MPESACILDMSRNWIIFVSKINGCFFFTETNFAFCSLGRKTDWPQGQKLFVNICCPDNGTGIFSKLQAGTFKSVNRQFVSCSRSFKNILAGIPGNRKWWTINSGKVGKAELFPEISTYFFSNRTWHCSSVFVSTDVFLIVEAFSIQGIGLPIVKRKV